MTVVPASRRFLLVQVALSAAFAIHALFGPALGLGSGEDAIAYRWFGLTRTASAGLAVASLAPFLLSRLWRAIALCMRWTLRPPNPNAWAVADALRRNVGPGLIVSFVALVVSLAGLEVWFRLTTPFELFWLTTRAYDPQAGLLYKPGSVVRKSNQLEFWQETRVNRLGFLDREPRDGWSDGACRIAIIGDSYVEAPEVPVEAKLHVQLERGKFPGIGFPIEADAYGIAGTGQVNQLAFYDSFVAKAPPDVLVLVVVRNDVGDNHPAFQSLAYGTLPDALPFRTVRLEDGRFVVRAPNPEWRSFRPPPPPAPPAPSLRHRMHATVIEWSYLYMRTVYWLRLVAPEAANWLLDQPAADTTPRYEHIDRIEAQMGYPLFGWMRGEGGDPVERMIAGEPPPRIYEEAFAATGWAFAGFAARARASGTRLVALHTWWLTDRLTPEMESDATLRRWAGYLRARLDGILASVGIPVLGQADWIHDRERREINEASFKRDAHWSATGHKWAAAQIADFVANDKDACSRIKRR
ncbi:MAG: hypothetical protein HY059_16820 [Proteobacteria bacterium]|nr:hypothetical protein [Pseudomonadota bacterium]